MKPRSGASRDPMELRQEDLDMDIESILDAGHENQPAEKQVDADFFNGADSESTSDPICGGFCTPRSLEFQTSPTCLLQHLRCRSCWRREALPTA